MGFARLLSCIQLNPAFIMIIMNHMVICLNIEYCFKVHLLIPSGIHIHIQTPQ